MKLVIALVVMIAFTVSSLRDKNKNAFKKVINMSKGISKKVNKIDGNIGKIQNDILSGVDDNVNDIKEQLEGSKLGMPCFVGQPCGSCPCCLGACALNFCVGGCIGLHGNADDGNSRALNGPVYGNVTIPEDLNDGDCFIGGPCGDSCECCNGQCVTQNGRKVCIGNCFSKAGTFEYSRKEPEGNRITSVALSGSSSCRIGAKCGVCDCCSGGFCISDQCFGACLNSNGDVKSFNAVVAPGEIDETTKSVAKGIGGPCGSCPFCLGPCVFGQCLGVCVGASRQLETVYAPGAERFGSSTLTIRNGRQVQMNYYVAYVGGSKSGSVAANSESSQPIFFIFLITKVRATQADNSLINCEYTSSGTGYRTFAICDAANNGCLVCRPGQSGCCM